MSTMRDLILIDGLDVQVRIGVPDEERRLPQRLLIRVEMATDVRPAAAGDDLSATIDYFRVCQRLKAVCGEREWRLIETLAEHLARCVLDEFRAEAVTLEIQKFILPDTRFVGVRIHRERS